MPLAISLDEHYTYQQYKSWPDDQRWELIDGTPQAMTAPSRLHQQVVLAVGAQLYTQLSDTPCEPYVAPFDVRLPNANEQDDDIDTVVQPDIVVVCDSDKLDEKGCRGAPDWVIEVLSPSTALKDMNSKRDLYEKHGVREYWLVHPVERWVMIYLLGADELYGKGLVVSMDEPTVCEVLGIASIDWEFLAV